MTLRWKLARLGAMSLPEVVYRGSKSARALLESAGLGLARPGTPVGRTGNSWLQTLPNEFSVAKYRSAADAILSGQFHLFGLQTSAAVFPPRWNRDPKTGTEAPMSFGKSIDYREASAVGDIKYLWEPNRHLELVTLAQAWHLSGEARYAFGCKTLLDSWFEQCPYPLGPNWTSSLELAIRLLNWSFSWHLLDGERAPIFESPDGEVFKRRWLDSVYRHCHYIAGYQSRYSSANNHLLGELLGMFAGSLTWPLWTESAGWIKQAHSGLRREALAQNSPDGVNKEQATWYHHEVADMMLIAGLLGRANGHEFDPEYWNRWSRMLDFIASVMDVAGNVPAIGDADDALMVRLSPEQDFSPYRSLLASGAVLLARPDLKGKAGRFDDKSRWLLGDAAAKQFEAMHCPVDRPAGRRSFPEGGYYILGSDLETAQEVRIVADAGPLGYLSIAAHGHADALSFTLSAGGQEILVDPGTYSYHAERQWRDYFRGTSAHNTLRIDARDQSRSGGAFLWTSHATATCEHFEITEQQDKWVASHDGYLGLPDPVRHRRELLYDRAKRVLEVTDFLQARASHAVEIFWHFSPACDVRLADGMAVAITGSVSLTLSPPPDMEIQIVRGSTLPPLGWFSRRLGSKESCATLVARRQINGGWQGKSKIQLLTVKPPEAGASAG